MNNWSIARLNYLLNPGHENETYGGSLYWNRKSGTCYFGVNPFSGENNPTTSCDFTSTGLNDRAKSMIGDAKWYLGGSSTYDDVTSQMFYTRERGTTVYSGRSTSWIGKVGLMYPSDYGYATSGGSSRNRASCFKKELIHWTNSSYYGDYSDCKNNDWLLDPSVYQWTMAPDSSDPFTVFVVFDSGEVRNDQTRFIYTLRPVVHLKSTIKIISGIGSSTDPFILSEN